MRDGTRMFAYLGAISTTALLAIVFVATVPAVGVSQSPADLPTEPAVVVDLDADGSARLTLTVAFDLTSDSERQAFRAFQANTSEHEIRTTRFASRMGAIADRAETAAGRNMTVRNPAIAFALRNDTGIVALSVTWDGLAFRRADALVIREPFLSGVDLDRRFTIIGPDGYELTSASPPPSDRTQTSATWAPQTSLEGFEARFVPSTNTVSDQTDVTEQTQRITADAPGFGYGVAVAGVFIGATMVAFRARSRR